MAPQLGEAAINSYLGGNLGTSGSSTFGANYNAGLQAAAQQDAVLGGQQYYTNDLNNFLNSRSNLATTQLQPTLQADEFNQSQNQNQAQIMDNYNLGAAGVESGLAGMDFGASNAQAQTNLQAQEFNAQSRGGLISSLTGGIGGLIGGAAGLAGGGGGMFGGQGFGGGQGYQGGGGNFTAGGGFSGVPPISMGGPSGMLQNSFNDPGVPTL